MTGFLVDKADQELELLDRGHAVSSSPTRLGMLPAGRIIDKVGTKKGYAYSLIGWSFAAMGHAFGHHTWSFGFWRAALGVTESGNFPAANKTMAEWFPEKGTRLCHRPLQFRRQRRGHRRAARVPYIADRLGLGMGLYHHRLVGLLWLVFWYTMYDSPAAKLAKRRAFPSGIRLHPQRSGRTGGREGRCRPRKKSPGSSCSPSARPGRSSVGKFLTDPIWWFYLFWLPAYLR